MITEKVTIRRIGPTSALKAGAAVGLVLGVIAATLDPSYWNLFGPGILNAIISASIVCPLGGGVSALVAAWVLQHRAQPDRWPAT